MKKAKLVLLLAVLFGAASAFTTGSSNKNLNTYVAVYDTETTFHWELLEGEFSDCSVDPSKVCSVQAESTPANNDKPDGYIPGQYIP
jgi:hypothetical protein